MEKRVKPSFCVIGKEGSTDEGEGFIQRLWADANGHFGEVAALAKRDAEGNLCGIWGAMSDFSRSFRPWEDFRRGLYLAGIEAEDGAIAPPGWTKWTIPGYEYAVFENDGPEAFGRALAALRESGETLVGAAHDFNCPDTGKGYIWMPVRKI